MVHASACVIVEYYKARGEFGEQLSPLFSKLPSASFSLMSPSSLLGSLRNDDGDGNVNGKKEIGLDKQNNNFAHASRFFVHFSTVVARLQRENA